MTYMHPKQREAMWTKMYREDALRKQDNLCCYCKEPLTRKTATADHVTARSRGGPTIKENIKACCKDCNRAKDNMTVSYFRKQIKNPPYDASMHIRMAHFRLRIWTQVEKTEKRILGAVGL